MDPSSRHDLPIMGSLTAAVAATLFACSGGQVLNVDAAVYLAQAESVWLGRSLEDATRDLPAFWRGAAFWPRDRWGGVRARFAPGAAVVLGPGVLAGAAGRAVSGSQRVMVATVVAWTCLLQGLGCALLWAAFRRLGASTRVATAAALASVLGDAGTWRVASTVWSESAIVPVVGAAWFVASASPGRRTPLGSSILGALIGALPWIHASLWPVAAVACVAAWRYARSRTAHAWLVVASAGVVAGALAAYNATLFGDALRGGYVAETGYWSASVLTGIAWRAWALASYHAPAVAGYAGGAWAVAYLWRSRVAAATDAGDAPRRHAAALAAGAAVLGIVHVGIYALRPPEMMDRLLTPQAVLLAPGLLFVFERSSAWRARAAGILAACGIGSACLLQIWSDTFVARVATAEGVRAVPRVWWVMLGIERGGAAWAWGAGSLAVAAAAVVALARATTRRARDETADGARTA